MFFKLGDFMAVIALEKMAICDLWQEKEKWDYLPLPYVLHRLENCYTSSKIPQSYFGFINPLIDHSVKRVIKALIAFIKSLRLIDSIMIYDLTEYDNEFSFIAPQTLLPYHLTQALKAIHEDPDKLDKYAYIGFKREQLEQILGFSLLTDEQLEIISELEKRLLQSKPQKEIIPDTPSQREADLLQIIAGLIQELVKYEHRLKRGNKINKTQLATVLSSSQINFLFKNPKGEESFRQILKKMDIPLQ